MSYKLYGIPNCDTVKKVRTLLEKKQINYEFVDFKKTVPTKKQLQQWSDFLGGELPVNKRGTTFRALKDEWEEGAKTARLELLIKNTSAIKRPILEKGNAVLMIGHEPEIIEKLKT